MPQESMLEKLNRLVEQKPFRPFSIVLDDGRSISVHSPRCLAYRSNTPIVYLEPRGRFHEFSPAKIKDFITSEQSDISEIPSPKNRTCEPMTAEQFDDTINALCTRVPFHPFTIEFVNGSQVEIDHPRGIVNTNGKASMFLPGGKPLWFGCDTVSKIIGEMASELAS